jgi:hypothetical protein
MPGVEIVQGGNFGECAVGSVGRRSLARDIRCGGFWFWVFPPYDPHPQKPRVRHPSVDISLYRSLRCLLTTYAAFDS